MLKFVKYSLIALIFYFIFKKIFQIDFDHVFLIKNYNLLFLALAVRLFAQPYFMASKLNIILKDLGLNFSIFKLVKIQWIARFYGLLLPSSEGFEAIKIYLLEKKIKNSKGKPTSAIIFDRLFGLGVFSFLCFVSTLFSKRLDGLPLQYISFAILFISISAVTFLSKGFHKSLISSHFFKNLLSEKTFNYIDKTSKSFLRVNLKNIFIKAFIMNLFVQIIGVLVVDLIFKSFGISLPFITQISTITMIQLISLLPLSIGGFGLREGAFIYFYSNHGIDDAICIGISLLYYLIISFPTAIAGGVLSIKDNNLSIKTFKTK